MSFGRDRTNCIQFLLWIQEAFIAAGDIVVHFDAEDIALLGVANDAFSVGMIQAISTNPHVVGPVLLGVLRGG